MTRSAIRKAVVGSVAAMTAVTVAACSSGSASSTGAVAKQNPSLTKSVIKVGLLISQTGASSSSDKPGAAVARAWEKWVNAGPGIAGHPVKVVIKDDKSDAASSVAAAKEFLSDKSILSLTSQTSNTETAASGVLRNTDLPVIGATGYNPQIWGALPNYFSTAPSATTDVISQFASAKAVGASRWSAAYCTEVASCKASEPLYAPAAQQEGIQYTGSLAVSLSAPSYTAECLKLKKSGTDFLQIAFAPAGAKRFVSDCGAQGYTGWYGATAGSVGPDITGIKGIKLAGGLQGFPWWADDPKVAQFRDAMDKYAHGDSYETPGATAVWAALELTRKAMAGVGDNPTRQDVFTGLYGLHDEDLGGLLPQKMTYTKGKGAPQVNCIWLYRMENGKFASAAAGPSGNSASGDLKTSCVKPIG